MSLAYWRERKEDHQLAGFSFLPDRSFLQCCDEEAFFGFVGRSLARNVLSGVNFNHNQAKVNFVCGRVLWWRSKQTSFDFGCCLLQPHRVPMMNAIL
jgi:hypothetical protein